jgi:signal transduction histidine kinase
MNLLVNAAQAIQSRGVITIATGADAENGWVWIRISDTGCGIPQENLKRVFEPFFTTKPVGSGTGLGLSLSYSIVNKHGGRIDVASKRDVGTVFTIRLPVVPPASTAPAPAGA